MANYKSYDEKFKLAVAIEAASNTKTITQIASERKITPSLVSQWRAQLLDEGAQWFKRKKKTEKETDSKQVEELQQLVGKIMYENDWLKKKYSLYQSKSGKK